jgi:hypothetical protein
VSGPVVNGKLPEDWFQLAKCSCMLFLERQIKPCVHILCLYIMLCVDQLQSAITMQKSIAAIRDKQRRRETDSSVKGFRFPNASRDGYEFVHTMLGLRGKEQKDVLANAKSDCADLMEHILDDRRKKWKPQGVVLCAQTTRLLLKMNDDSYRRLVPYHRPTPSGFWGLHQAKKSRGPIVKKRTLQETFPELDCELFPVISALKQRKLKEKSAGASRARQMLTEGTSALFCNMRTKVARR